MSKIVRYVGDETRNFNGTWFEPGQDVLFDDAYAAAQGRDNADDFAEFFVYLYTDGGKRPWLELHDAKADGTAKKGSDALTLSPSTNAHIREHVSARPPGYNGVTGEMEPREEAPPAAHIHEEAAT